MRVPAQLERDETRVPDGAQRADVVRQEGGIEVHGRTVAHAPAPRRMNPARASEGYPAISGRQLRAGDEVQAGDDVLQIVN